MQKVKKSLPADAAARPVVTRPFSQPGGIAGLLPAPPPPPPPFPVMIKSPVCTNIPQRQQVHCDSAILSDSNRHI